MTRRRGLSTLAAAAVGALVLAHAAEAQRVYWEQPGDLATGQRATLDLVFADTQPAGHVVPPQIDHVAIVGPPSQASNVSIVNGRRSASTTLSYPIRAEREGTVRIPSFTVETTDGTKTVAPLAFEVAAESATASGRGPSSDVDQLIDARLTPSNLRPYAGQVIDVEVRVGLKAGRSGQVVGTPTWDTAGMVAEPWSDGQSVVTPSGGSSVRFRTRAIAPAAGRIEVGPVHQEVQIEAGGERSDPFDGFDDAFNAFRKFGGADLLDSFFARAHTTAATLKSNAAQLDVQPLPQPAPAGFTGAIGHFQIESTFAPQQPKTGEPITWTLTLKGMGNWPGGVELPARAVPADIRTLQPKQHKDFADGVLFDGTVSEDLVLVPDQPGDYRFDPVRFVYFDPDTGRYETVEAQPPVLHVTGAPVADPPKNAPAPVKADAAPAAAAPVAPASNDAIGPLLPRDPRPGVASGLAPLARPLLAWIGAVPFAMLALYWLALVIHRARLRDPRRPQREAWRGLAPAIARVRAAATTEGRLGALLAWQRTVAVALGIDLAAPTATQLPDPRWKDVWADSERTIYGPQHDLAAGWCDCALALCAAPSRRSLPSLRALRFRRFVPKAALAAGLLALAVGTARAADPLAAYDSGDFDAARRDLFARAQAAPGDWIARYNLGLAEAQIGDASRGFGETLAAFVHAPRDPDVRWNLHALAAANPGIDFGAAAVADTPASLLSPVSWEAMLIAAAIAVCVGAALRMRRSYGRPSGPARHATALLVIGVAAGVGALLSLRAYGALADPRAAVVAGQPLLRSVPTEADAAQQQRPLPAGTLGVTERTFLGWTKIRLASGESGWLRSGDLVPLYAAPST